MKRKSPPPVLPLDLEQPAPALGFTVWVHLARPASAAEVKLFRYGLDRYLETNELARSLNPLHMLVWSAERSLTVADQVDLLTWLIVDGRAAAVEIGDLQTHMGLPASRDRVRMLPARPADHSVLTVTSLYRTGQLEAEQFVEMLGGYRAPVALH